MATATRAVVTGGAGASLIAVALGIAVPEIKEFEGRRLVPYLDIVKVLTVCDGKTGPEVIVNKVYTHKECDAMTAKDAAKYASGVLKVSPHLAWHPMQLAAAISFSYNVGLGTYQTSTVSKLFNKGDFLGACNFLPNYKYAGGKVSTGLVNRRARERMICLSTLTPEGMKNVLN